MLPASQRRTRRKAQQNAASSREVRDNEKGRGGRFLAALMSKHWMVWVFGLGLIFSGSGNFFSFRFLFLEIAKVNECQHTAQLMMEEW